MAKTNIVIGAKDETTDVLSKIQKSVEALSAKVKGGFTEGEASVLSFNAALELGQKAAEFLAENVGKSLEMFAELEKSNTRFSAMFANVADSVGLTKGAMDRLGESVSTNSLFDGSVVKNAETILMTFQDIRGEAFEKTIKVASDMASALGMELPDATKILGKALEDPVKGFQTLRREGVTFTDAQKEQITALEKSGDKLGAMNVMLSTLAAKFQGVGEALSLTSSGQLVKFGQSLEEAQKAGGKLLTDFLGPLAAIGTPIIKAFAEAVLQTGTNAEKFNASIAAEIEHSGELTEKTSALLGVVDSKNESDKLTLNQYDTLLTLYPQLKGQIDIYSTSLREAEGAVKKLQEAEKAALQTKLEQASISSFGQFQKADAGAVQSGKSVGRPGQAATTDLTAMSMELDYAEAQQAKFHQTSGMEINYWKEYADALRQAKTALSDYIQTNNALKNLHANGTIEAKAPVADDSSGGSPLSDAELKKAAEEGKKIALVRKEAQDAVQREASDNDRMLIDVDKAWIESLKVAAAESKQIANDNQTIQAGVQKGAEATNKGQIAVIEQQKQSMAQYKQIFDTLGSGVLNLYSIWSNADAQNTQAMIANQQRVLDNYKTNQTASIAAMKAAGQDTTAAQLALNTQVALQQNKIQQEQADAKKKAWQANQLSQEGQIVMSTANAIMAALALAPPAGEILAGVVGAIGATELALVASQPMPQFAEGGIVGGNSTSGDKVHALVNSGEMVLTGPQQSQLLSMAKGTTPGGGGTHYHMHGNSFGLPSDEFFNQFQKRMTKLQNDGKVVS